MGRLSAHRPQERPWDALPPRSGGWPYLRVLEARKTALLLAKPKPAPKSHEITEDRTLVSLERRRAIMREVFGEDAADGINPNTIGAAKRF